MDNFLHFPPNMDIFHLFQRIRFEIVVLAANISVSEHSSNQKKHIKPSEKRQTSLRQWLLPLGEE